MIDYCLVYSAPELPWPASLCCRFFLGISFLHVSSSAASLSCHLNVSIRDLKGLFMYQRCDAMRLVALPVLYKDNSIEINTVLRIYLPVATYYVLYA